MQRQPAVAGQFYPGSPQELSGMLQAFIDTGAEKKDALVAVSPHAGYVYSGPVAGQVLGRINIPRRVLLMGPNHRGLGAQAAVMTSGQWLTPLGAVELDPELGSALIQNSPLVQEDALAHQYEHSLEVQVPFLQALMPELRLTPLCLGHLELSACLELGRAAALAIKGLGEPVLMVASTDMTHYEPAALAKQQDLRAIEHILALDPAGLYNTVRNNGITMCGVLPTTVCLAAALELGASQAELVAYTNSGEVSGDFDQVVGYAGLIIS